jgi:hypothetical protein
MHKSTDGLIWDFIVLCNKLKAFNKIHEYEEFTDHCFDESVNGQYSTSFALVLRRGCSPRPGSVALSAYAPVPQAPRIIEGLINRRG